VRRIIGSTKTQEFFRQGSWTPDPAVAPDFPGTRELLAVCAAYHLRDVELALQLEHEPPGGCGVRVPLPATD
jgi:hypothetical protein